MAESIAIIVNGVAWQVRPDCREPLLGPEGLRLADWLEAGQARVLKHGPQRTVYRVELPELTCCVKHNRLPNTRAWLRELVRPAKARIEYEKAHEVASRGVPTFVPLAVGERAGGEGPGESFLVTRYLERAEPLSDFIEVTLPGFAPRRLARVRLRLAEALADLLARMHDAGIVHGDLHPGNLLIRLDDEDRPSLFLIDLHAVTLRAPLDWQARRDNLVILNRWFVMRGSRSDRLRFWHAYVNHQQRLAPGGDAAPPSEAMFRQWRDDLARELERQTWQSNLVFWRNRDARCLTTNKYYEQVRSGTVKGFALCGLDRRALDALLADPDAAFRDPGAALLKDSRSSTVAELEWTTAGVPRRVVFKRFRVTRWTDPWAALVRRSPALRSWVHGQGLWERRLPTPRPLAVFHRYHHGLPQESYLLVEKVEQAQDLHRYLAGLNRLDPAERRRQLRARIDQIAQLLRELHRCRLAHRDLKAGNLLVRDAADGPPGIPARLADAEARFPGIWLIDLVGMSRHQRLGRARKVRNLARLNASFLDEPALTRTDRLRFLRVYLQWGLLGHGSWKRWWHEIDQATQAKAARNARTGRPLA